MSSVRASISSEATGRSPEPSSIDNTRADIATNNYGSQVAYNYGSISNYFCHNPDAAHHCDFPTIPRPGESPESQLYTKIQRARELYESKRWTDAKVLFYEILYAQDAAPEVNERILIRYHVAHAHFALAEFSDAVRHFQHLVNIQEEESETLDKCVSDSRYWLGRSFYHLKSYENASMHLQVFVLTHEEQGSHRANQVTDGRLWLGLTLERLELYDSAKEQLQLAFSSRVQSLGPEHLETLASRHHLANFLYKRKSFLEAYEHFNPLLFAEERLRGPEWAEAIQTRCMVALCLAELERYEEAEPHLQRVLNRLESYRGWTRHECIDGGLAFYWLGRLALNRKVFKEAERLFQRALTHLSVDIDLNGKVVDCQRYLALTMGRQGQHAGAEQVLRQVIVVMEETKQGDLIAARFWLASNLVAQKKFVQATSMLEEFVTSKSPLENCCHSGEDLAACLHLLGQTKFHLDQLLEARDCFQQIVDVEPEKSNEHYNVSRFWLGRTLFDLQDFTSALKYFQAIYDIEKQNPQTTNHHQIRCWLAWALCEVGHFDEAESHIQSTFIISPPSTEERPPPQFYLFLGRNNYYLARIMSHRKDIREATRLFRVALPILVGLFGLEDRTCLECRYYLACSLFHQHQHGEARKFLEELLKCQSQQISAQNIRSILAPFWLARILIFKGKNQDAKTHLTKCLDSWGSDAFYDNVTRQDVRYFHACCIYNMKKYEECIPIAREFLNALPPDGDEGENFEHDIGGRSLLGRSLYFTGNYGEASGYLKSVLADFESIRGFDHPQTAITRVYLADSLFELERYNEADPLLPHVTSQGGALPGTGPGLMKALGTYLLGYRAFSRQQLKEAEDNFHASRALLTGPSNTLVDRIRFDCRHFLARIQLRRKQYADAESVFLELSGQQFESGHVNRAVDNQYWIGLSLMEQQKLSAAIPIFQKIVDDDKEGKATKQTILSSRYYLGNCLFRTRKFKEAKIQFEIALETSEDFAKKYFCRFFQARCNYSLAQFGEARDKFQALVDLSHKDPQQVVESQYWLGRSHFEMKNWDGARIALQLAHDASKKEWRYSLDCQYFLGRADFNLKNYETAKSRFQSTFDAQKESQAYTSLYSQYYMGLCLLELKLYNEAKVLLLQVLTKQQKYPLNLQGIMPTRYQIARCLAKMGIYSQAQSEFEGILPFFLRRSQAGDETIVDIQYHLGCIAFQKSEWERALGFFQETLLNHETVHVNSSLDVLQCQHQLARALVGLQRHDEGLQLLQKVLEKCKENSHVLKQLLVDTQLAICSVLYGQRKFAEASVLMREVVEWQQQSLGMEHPNCLTARLMLADIVYGLSEFDEARKFYTETLAQVESSEKLQKAVFFPLATSYARFALTLSKLDLVDEAREVAVKAIRFVSTNKDHSYREVSGFVEFLGDPFFGQSIMNFSPGEQSQPLSDLQSTSPTKQDVSGNEEKLQSLSIEEGTVPAQGQTPAPEHQETQLPSLSAPEQRGEQQPPPPAAERQDIQQASLSAPEEQSESSPSPSATKATPSLIATAAVGVKKPPPRPSRKPAYLQQKVLPLRSPSQQACEAASSSAAEATKAQMVDATRGET